MQKTGMRFFLSGLLILSPISWADSSVSVGRHGMVVSAQHLATQVGVDILRRGGNAIDAAVAMGYALAVVEPCCGNIGGGGFMLIHHSNGNNIVLNFRENAPAGLKVSLLEKKDQKTSYLTVGIPGTVKGLNTALKHYGTMSLKQVMQPAIQLADKGFILKQQDAQFLSLGTDSFRKSPNVSAIFLKHNRPYQVGDRLIQKQLAHTLKLIAEQGDYAFYQGAIADELVKASAQHGGWITQSDLANYKITFEKPLSCHYRGYSLIVTPPPSTGGVVLCELLNLMQGFPLKTYGYGSLKSLATNIEAIRYVYQDKNKYLGDPAFKKESTRYLLSEPEAEAVRKKIKSRTIDRYSGSSAQESAEPFNTTSYLIADSKGNRVAVTYTLNGAFGSQVIAGQTGFFLNNELKDFIYGKSASQFVKQFGMNPDSPASNKRPASFITQAFIFDGRNQPFLMLASPGGDTIPTQLLIAIENFLDYKMSLQTAMNAPRYHFRWQKGTVHMEPEWTHQGKKALLQSAGYVVGKGSGSELGLPYWGAMTAIYFNASKGYFEGVIDHRRPAGMAKGY